MIIIQAKRPGGKWGTRSVCKDINFRLAENKIDQKQAKAEAASIIQDWIRNYQHDPASLRVAECQ